MVLYITLAERRPVIFTGLRINVMPVTLSVCNTYIHCCYFNKNDFAGSTNIKLFLSYFT